MTLGRALVTNLGPYMLAAKAEALIAAEVGKGCDGTILSNPVSLEPYFSPISVPRDIMALKDNPFWIYENPPLEQDLVRFQVWISPDQPFDWVCLELLLKQLLTVSSRVGLEIMGNQERIVIMLLCHRSDMPVVQTAFRGKLKFCKLSPLKGNPFLDLGPQVWEKAKFYDYYPPPPYSHLLTRPNELHSSPYECLITAMADIPAPAKGVYQILFQPVSPAHNWHRNIEILMDFEYMVKQVSNVGYSQRYAQQAPSGDLRQMAGEVETKAHNDKPLYAMAFRVAVLGGNGLAHDYLKSLAVFSSLFQHGGRPLEFLTEADYQPILSPQQLRQMFRLGLTFRPGSLVNSAELTGLVHLPPATMAEHLEVSTDILDTLAITNNNLSEGTPIGICRIANSEKLVCIPRRIRLRHTHLIGKPDVGKSTAEEHMIIDDINNDHGVAVLDPHGDLAERLLALIPEAYMNKVIYFDPGDPYWVPLWNPMQKIPGQDNGRLTDDLVGVLKSFVTGWGDRMEHILRHSIFALLHLSGSTLLDIADLLRGSSKESETTRRLILDVVENEEARKFWQHDFTRYRPDELTPPKHKLSKLLVGGTLSMMLSQPHSSFNFRRIMDDGVIFIANLSRIGTEVRQILGGFILAVIHMTALSRSDIPKDKRKVFHTYLDEAHRFVTDSLEDIIAETRKYGVSLTLAHQYMRQFTIPQMDAVASVGTTIVFNVDTKDAIHLSKGFQGLVKPDDIIDLDIFQAIIRCGRDTAKIHTLAPLEIPEKNFKSQIIEQSHRKYCMPAPQVRKNIEQRGERANRPFEPLDTALKTSETNNTVKERDYEEH
ncbi:type IV secretory system conjugative DNA transfer family protein [Planctomycetota bacterium]